MTRPRLSSWLLAAFGAFLVFLALPWPAPASGIDAPRGALVLSGAGEAAPAPIPAPTPQVAPVAPPVQTSELRLAEATLDRVADRYVAPLGSGRAVLTTVPRLQERIEKALADYRVPWAAVGPARAVHRPGAGHGRALAAGAGPPRALARGPCAGRQRLQDRHQLGPAPARLRARRRGLLPRGAAPGAAVAARRRPAARPELPLALLGARQERQRGLREARRPGAQRHAAPRRGRPLPLQPVHPLRPARRDLARRDPRGVVRAGHHRRRFRPGAPVAAPRCRGGRHHRQRRGLRAARRGGLLHGRRPAPRGRALARPRRARSPPSSPP